MSSKDPKYIQDDPICVQNRRKWGQMSKPKWMSSNFDKIFTSDAYPV